MSLGTFTGFAGCAPREVRAFESASLATRGARAVADLGAAGGEIVSLRHRRCTQASHRNQR